MRVLRNHPECGQTSPCVCPQTEEQLVRVCVITVSVERTQRERVIRANWRLRGGICAQECSELLQRRVSLLANSILINAAIVLTVQGHRESGRH